MLSKLSFWLVSRPLIVLYRFCPLIRPARGSICILQAGDLFLMIDRNDGLGLCFPGGSARHDESDEDAMKREVFEETGLRVTRAWQLYRYQCDVFYPHTTTVFKGETAGELTKSWEGTPVWLRLADMKGRIFPPHQRVLLRLMLDHSM